MTKQHARTVLIIGGEGEFGRFLCQDILPSIGVIHVSVIERDTPREEHQSLLKNARHVVLATPLAGYAERACELTKQKDPAKLRTLAAAYAEEGRFDDARATIEKVLELDPSPAIRLSAQLMLEHFKSRRSWRDSQDVIPYRDK